MTELIPELRRRLSGMMPETIVDTWFSDLELISLEDETLVLCSPAAFKRELICARYLPALCEAASAVLGGDITVNVVEPVGVTPAVVAAAANNTPRRSEDPKFSFAAFVVGENNKFAYNAACAVADAPGAAYNPLMIYGLSGLGKTHLLHAIKNAVSEKFPDKKIKVLSAETFTNDLVVAIREKKQEQFRQKYRTCDLLLLDDIQFIAGKDFSQEEFFHTFNAMYENNKQIVMTSDRPPRDLKLLEDRLRTRFEWGLIADVKPPDFETRMAIVQKKAASLGLILEQDVLTLIASTITVNVRQLEGIVNKLLGERDLMQRPITLETTAEALSDLARQNPGANPTPAFILDEVCKYFRLDKLQLVGKSRQAGLVRARQIAMYLIRTLTQSSLDEMGKFFDRDHTTVMHGVNSIDNKKAEDAELENDLRNITENIKGT